MLIDKSTRRIRLTKPELNLVRSMAAKNGYAVQEVTTISEAMEAHIKALPLRTVNDMLQFIETGTSTLTSASSVEELHKLLAEE